MTFAENEPIAESLADAFKLKCNVLMGSLEESTPKDGDSGRKENYKIENF
jgi:hypothetical protein